MSTEDLPRVMLEYATAIRGDWSDFDGRSERNVIQSWVAEMREPTGKTIERWRAELVLCPEGGGHWEYHCRELHPQPTVSDHTEGNEK